MSVGPLDPNILAAYAAAQFALLLANISLAKRGKLLNASLICAAVALPGLIILWKVADLQWTFQGWHATALLFFVYALLVTGFASVLLAVLAVHRAAGWVLVATTLIGLGFLGAARQVPVGNELAPAIERNPSGGAR